MAANLRVLCKQRGTISQVCSELGINRQQFSKYLSGETFPRRGTLELICSYFGVEEIELFKSPNQQVLSLGLDGDNAISPKVIAGIVRDLHHPQDVPVDDGFYLCYIRARSDPNWVIRSIMSVKSVGSRTEFRRLTGFAEKRNSPWRLSLGNHRGLILNRRGILYFLALDEYASKTPTIAIMQWTATKEPLLKGKCIALAREGADVCDVVIEKLPAHISLREAIKQSGAIGIKESNLPLHIKQIIHNM